MSVEVLLIDALSASLGVPVVADVPRDRPDLFVTVELAGGTRTAYRDEQRVSLGCWAPSRFEASQLAELVADDVRDLALSHPRVARVTISSVYNNPDPESGHPRYQVNAELVTV